MTGKGTTFRLKHLQGKRLTPAQAIMAKCSDCMADYVDGREDCAIPTCPLYPWMPYSSAPREKIRRKGIEDQAENDGAKIASTEGLEED